ncbi:hypothetical protein BHE74_00048352, partial [Ensete ventricosum]
LGRNEIIGVRITNILKSWLEIVGAIVVARRFNGKRRGSKRLWQQGQQRQGRRQRQGRSVQQVGSSKVVAPLLKRAGQRQEQVRQRRLRQSEEKAEEIKAAVEEGSAVVKKWLGRDEGSGQRRLIGMSSGLLRLRTDCHSGKQRKRAGLLLRQGRRWLAVSGSGKAEARAGEGGGSGVNVSGSEQGRARGRDGGIGQGKKASSVGVIVVVEAWPRQREEEDSDNGSWKLGRKVRRALAARVGGSRGRHG